MRLQKLIHNKIDIAELEEDTIIVHGVNEIELGSIKKCDCEDCLKTIQYFKSLK